MRPGRRCLRPAEFSRQDWLNLHALRFAALAALLAADVHEHLVREGLVEQHVQLLHDVGREAAALVDSRGLTVELGVTRPMRAVTARAAGAATLGNHVRARRCVSGATCSASG